MNDELMLKWASERFERVKEQHRVAANLLKTAQRDLNGIRNGRPSAICNRRFNDWKSLQPRQEMK